MTCLIRCFSLPQLMLLECLILQEAEIRVNLPGRKLPVQKRTDMKKSGHTRKEGYHYLRCA